MRSVSRFFGTIFQPIFHGSPGSCNISIAGTPTTRSPLSC